MGIILTYQKDGVKYQKKIDSYYKGVIEASELRKQGYKVKSEQTVSKLVPRYNQKTDKEMVKDFLNRANKIKSIRKHGVRERGCW